LPNLNKQLVISLGWLELHWGPLEGNDEGRPKDEPGLHPTAYILPMGKCTGLQSLMNNDQSRLQILVSKN